MSLFNKKCARCKEWYSKLVTVKDKAGVDREICLECDSAIRNARKDAKTTKGKDTEKPVNNAQSDLGY